MQKLKLSIRFIFKLLPQKWNLMRSKSRYGSKCTVEFENVSQKVQIAFYKQEHN